MKLGFSTLGCPEWSVDLIIEKAVEYGFDGVEFRGYLGELDLRNCSLFSETPVKTAEKFESAKIEIPCFSTSVRLYSKSDNYKKESLSEIEFYSELCEIFHMPYLRVFVGEIGNSNRQRAIERITKNLKKMAEIAERHNVKILLETHDDWTESKYLNMIMKYLNSDSIGILWDIHHPYVISGENPSLTWGMLGSWIKHTHWKDSLLEKESIQPCNLGEGMLSLSEFCNVLLGNSYTGYSVFEWEKKWYPELESPDTAFPKYMEFMNKMRRNKFNN